MPCLHDVPGALLTWLAATALQGLQKGAFATAQVAAGPVLHSAVHAVSLAAANLNPARLQHAMAVVAAATEAVACSALAAAATGAVADVVLFAEPASALAPARAVAALVAGTALAADSTGSPSGAVAGVGLAHALLVRTVAHWAALKAGAVAVTLDAVATGLGAVETGLETNCPAEQLFAAGRSATEEALAAG